MSMLLKLLLLFPVVAIAADTAPSEAISLIAQIGSLFGSKGVAVAATITAGIGVWSQLRPYIPNTWMAKLPTWLLTILEWLAGNHGQAENDAITGAKAIQQRQF